MIRTVQKNDVEAICTIYNYYVTNSIVTFEEIPVSVEEMCSRIDKVVENLPWFVFECEGSVVGYCYASKWKSRGAYRYSVESTVYVSENYVGRKIGKSLCDVLISRLKDLNIHSVIGGIALPNVSSVMLHEKLGFEKVAHFKEVGWKFNKWIDVGYWELIMPTKSAEQTFAGDISPRVPAVSRP